MSRERLENLPFLYREVISLEVQLLSGSPAKLKEPFILALPEALGGGPSKQELPSSVLALPWRLSSRFDLGEFLSLIKSSFIDVGASFPLILSPPLEESSHESLLEYLVAYEFREVKFLALIQERRAQAKVKGGITLKEEWQAATKEGADKIKQAFLADVNSSSPAPIGLWERLVPLGANHLPISCIHASIGDELAGFGVYLISGIHGRLVALYTVESARGRGIGEAILSHFFRKVQESEAMLITSVVPESANFKYYLGKFSFTEAFPYSLWVPPQPDFYKGA